MIAPTSKNKLETEVELLPEQLCPGLFVKLKLGWMDHPFVFNQFRIANQKQVEQILELGLARIAYVPSRSTASPLAPGMRAAPEGGGGGSPILRKAHPEQNVGEANPAGDPVSPSAASVAALQCEPATTTHHTDPLGRVEQGHDLAPVSATAAVAAVSAVPGSAQIEPAAVKAPANPVKEKQAKRIATVRARIDRCERGYVKAASQVRVAMQGLHSSSEKSIKTARGVVDGLVTSFSDDAEMVLHLMNEKLADETAYFHVLNVMVLSLMLGRELRLPADVLRVLGEGALFHDIGKLRVPDSVLRNPKRNRHEEEFYRLHTVYGREMAREMAAFPQAVADIIEYHHETLDGKGFPRGLKQEAIPLLARIVAITNRYDNLCNPVVRTEGVTPAEALAHMFRNESARWDKDILHRFVRMMGVYPPGSLVQLSNGNVGIVVAVDHADLLRPSVMVFDPDVPRSEAIVIDLAEEPEVKIDLALRPSDLGPDATEYLSPKRRMSYFQSNRAGG